MSQSKAVKQMNRLNAVAELRQIVRPGDTVYTILRRVSASGMSRDISLVAIHDGEIRDISGYVADALESRKIDSYTHRAVRVGGCGMDMGADLVMRLGYTLFPDAYTQEERDHWRYPGADYSLRQSWL